MVDVTPAAAPAAPSPAAAPAAAPKAAPAAKAPAAAPAAAQPVMTPAALRSAIARGEQHDPAAAAEPVEEAAPEGEETQIEETPAEENALEGEEAPAETSPYPAEIHGVPTAELLAALAEGKLPDALLDILQIECVDGDERWTGSLNDLRAGAQMRASFVRKSMALGEERRAAEAAVRQHEADKNEFYDYVRSWKDPAALRRAAKSMNLPIDQVAMAWAEEQVTLASMTPEQKAVWEANEARDLDIEKRSRELRSKERELQEQEARRAAHENTSKGDQYTKFLQAHVPTALASAGLDLADVSLRPVILAKFKECLGVFWSDPETPPTQDMINTAAKAAAQILGGARRAAAPVAATPGSPARQQAAAAAPVKAAARAPAPAALGGAKSYDPGGTRNPARQQFSAQTFRDALRPKAQPKR